MKEKHTIAQTTDDNDILRDQKERLISAALSLRLAIEMLASADLLAEYRPNVSQGVDFYEEVTRFEVRLIEDAMRQCKGNQKQASALLRIRHTTLNSMLKRYKIDRRAFAVFVSDETLEQLEQSKFYREAMVEEHAPAIS
jgi:DNA-binding NtrC family response regulator